MQETNRRKYNNDFATKRGSLRAQLPHGCLSELCKEFSFSANTIKSVLDNTVKNLSEKHLLILSSAKEKIVAHEKNQAELNAKREEILNA